MLHNRSSMMVVVLAAMVAGGGANCDACVEGRCYTRKTIARELNIPDQMAIDRKNGILYVHTDSGMDTAFLHDDLTIQLVRRQKFSGLAVDQDTQALYTGDIHNMHKYTPNSVKTTTIVDPDLRQSTYNQPDLLFYKDCLTYTEKSRNGLYSVIDVHRLYYPELVNYAISDFIVLVGCFPLKIYFVADGTVYFFNAETSTTKALTKNKYVLSTDKYDNVYFGDETLKVIFKMDTVTNKLVEYAAYETGSVDKFVFDNNNNMVSYDSSDGSFSYWKLDATEKANCTIEAPHSKYRIIKGVCKPL